MITWDWSYVIMLSWFISMILIMGGWQLLLQLIIAFFAIFYVAYVFYDHDSP